MDYISILKNCNLKATPQRIGILKNLAKKTHPTIDELYAKLRSENPCISLATVYKNVKALVEAKVITEINIPNQKLKYDFLDKEHVHLFCTNCSCIENIGQDDAKLKIYKDMLHQSLKKEITSINIIINSKTCSKCKK